jgi:hypothetical protein
MGRRAANRKKTQADFDKEVQELLGKLPFKQGIAQKQ